MRNGDPVPTIMEFCAMQRGYTRLDTSTKCYLQLIILIWSGLKLNTVSWERFLIWQIGGKSVNLKLALIHLCGRAHDRQI